MDVPHDIMLKLKARGDALLDDRDTWESHWTDVRDYILPWHGRALTDPDQHQVRDGYKKNGNIIDDTATGAAENLAAGLESGLTSPSKPWFHLTLSDPNIGQDREAQKYLEDVERILYWMFNRSDIYQGLHQFYLEMGTFGTACMLVNESFDTVLHGKPLSVGSYALGLNGEQKVDTLYREVRLTAKNIILQFGIEAVSDEVRRAYEEKRPDEEFVICQLIEPNDDRMDLRDAQGRAYRSVYWEKACKSDRVLQVSGYEEKPFMAARWASVGTSAYGYGPGIRALGDVKMLQKLHVKELQALDKEIDPPLTAGPGVKAINTLPGGVTTAPVVDAVRPLYVPTLDLQKVEFKIAQTQNRIREAFYNHLFMLIAQTDKTMTAREVSERHEEKLLMLGPVLTRLYTELLDPLINRAFAIADRNGFLPPPPQALAGQDLSTEYVSTLAQAQRMIGAYALEESVAFAGNMVGVFPETADVVDPDKIVRDYFQLKGASVSALRSEEDVAGIRQARAQQMAQQQAVEQMAQSAQTAKLLSEADMGGNSALQAALGGGA